VQRLLRHRERHRRVAAGHHRRDPGRDPGRLLRRHAGRSELHDSDHGARGHGRPEAEPRALVQPSRRQRPGRHALDAVDRPPDDQRTGYDGSGGAWQRTQRISEIAATYDGDQGVEEIATYALTYASTAPPNGTGRSQLTEVSVCRGSECLPETLFTTQNGDSGWVLPKRRAARPAAIRSPATGTATAEPISSCFMAVERDYVSTIATRRSRVASIQPQQSAAISRSTGSAFGARLRPRLRISMLLQDRLGERRSCAAGPKKCRDRRQEMDQQNCEIARAPS
jgi:hypothetical protein